MDSPSNFQDIEKKWSERWNQEKIFESNPEEKEKRYVTAAFPYPNSPQHIGHARTYTTTDIYARYLRLKGYNVLFPMAFHVTGTPILAMARRIAEGDQEIYDIFDRIYGIPPEKAKTLSDPKALVLHFSKEIEAGMKEMGFSIDWRRKFYSFDPIFNKFIQWQFLKLKQLGLLVQGEHPIAWCPKDNQAVGGHDTKGDIDPELKEFTAIKFAYNDGFLLTATLRPETIYGVTNIWINPNLVHIKARSKKTGEIYYLVKKAYDKMNFQGFQLEILEEFNGEKLVGAKAGAQKAKNPVTGEDVPIYPANYVRDDSGTGIVMSVPSHAPYDHVALVDMGIRLDYVPVVQVEGYKFMAQELVEQRGIKDQNDPKLEEIVKEVYKKEIVTGKMVLGPYKGEKVSVAIEKTRADLYKRKLALVFWELSNKPVYCRCGAEVIASVLKNQWFIDYSQPVWKEKAKECLEQMDVIPDKTRAEYLATIDWLKQKACARSQGLGTRFPFDDKLVIEALSDSTIYMAFYTISHLLHGRKHEQLDERFFDYVFLGKGSPPDRQAEGMRESFLYWYPLDSRHSGADLIRNHLPFFILNHVAIFGKKHWPRQIVTNGFVLMDGKKMSKSMGNILPLRKAIKEYGADVVRFSVVAGAEISSDTDFNRTVAEGVRSRLALIGKLIEGSVKEKASGKKHRRIDLWLLSRLNRKISRSDELYARLAIRELSLELFYDVFSDLQWYAKRSAGKVNLHDFFHDWTILISPFMPHVAEEYWERLGGKGFVSAARLPEADAKTVNDSIEHGEELVKSIHADIEKISGLIGKKPSRVTLCVASDWKRRLFDIAKEKKSFEGLMKEASARKMDMKLVSSVAKGMIKNIHSAQKPLSSKEELETLEDARKFLEGEYSCRVEVLEEARSGHEKAKNAMPDKPAIIIE